MKSNIDKEIEDTVNLINHLKDLRTIASCSGHNIYHKTIFYIDINGEYWEYYSGLRIIPIKRKSLCFYVFDKKTKLFFNPQVESFWNNNELI
jgi:hypothetical protein